MLERKGNGGFLKKTPFIYNQVLMSDFNDRITGIYYYFFGVVQ